MNRTRLTLRAAAALAATLALGALPACGGSDDPTPEGAPPAPVSSAPPLRDCATGQGLAALRGGQVLREDATPRVDGSGRPLLRLCVEHREPALHP